MLNVLEDITSVEKLSESLLDQVARLKSSHSPLIVTEHGEAAVVMLAAEEYQRLVELAEAQRDSLPARVRRAKRRVSSPIHYTPPRRVDVAPDAPKKRLLVKDLGWTPEQALANHYRYRSFAEDWNAPGMELYDQL